MQIDAGARAVVVEYREQVIKPVAIKGLIRECLPLQVYLDQMALEARAQYVVGRPVGQQLRLL